MAELFNGHYKDGDLICGSCHKRIEYPRTLTENGKTRLVDCPHCFRLNKVKRE